MRKENYKNLKNLPTPRENPPRSWLPDKDEIFYANLHITSIQ